MFSDSLHAFTMDAFNCSPEGMGLQDVDRSEEKGETTLFGSAIRNQLRSGREVGIEARDRMKNGNVLGASYQS